MPPSGVIGVMDEEAAIEAQIQLELEAINLDDDNLQDFEDEDYLDENDNIQEQEDDIIDVPHELDDYIKTIQDQSNRFEQELLECDSLLNPIAANDDRNLALIPYEDQTLLVELAKERGCTIEEYKKQILEEIANDDDIIVDELAGLIDVEEVPAIENDPANDEQLLAITQNGESGVDARMEGDIRKAVEEGMDPDEVPVSQDLIPVNGQPVLSGEIQKVLREQLERLETKYENRMDKIKKDEAYRRDEEEVQQRRMEEERQWKRQEIEREAQQQARDREAAEKESQRRQEKAFKDMEEEMKRFEQQISQLQAETERQKREHEMAKEQEQHRQAEKREKAAVKIQSKFRGYIVRKDIGSTLTEKKELWKKQKEEDRIKEVEVEIEKRKEEQRIQKEKEREEEAELKRQEEEKKRLKEEEKRQKEEEKKRLKEEEERKKQEEKKRKEEEKQRKKEEEKRRKEDEKKRKEEEKIRKEEEKRQKEEEEKRKKEEEKRLKEEEKQQKIEEKRLKEEEEKRKKEELQQGEEMKKKEGEEKTKAVINEKEVQKTQRDDKSSTDIKQELQEQSTEIKTENAGKENVGKTEESFNESKVANKQAEVTSSGDVNKSDNKPKVDDSKSNSNSVRPETPRSKTPRSARKKQSLLTPRKSLKDESKSTDEGDTNKDKDKPENVDMLPEPLEKLRLQFIKQCLPWSKVANEPWKLKSGISKKPLRRPASAKKLPLLSENLIIEAAKVASIKQVTTVQLSDLPGNNVSSLGQCWGLKYLSLTNSSLVAVDGLAQCKQLQYLDVRNNKLEFLDVKDIGKLQYVNASHNRLTSIHGVDNCTNLRWLDLSYNNITRLDGLETLRRLTTLRLSHNQLISTQGLGVTPTVQMLDLSHNHLQALEDVDKLCLLSSLDLSANNLLEVPKLTNQVLLQELLLEDNSISCLTELATTWLPLLIKLVISQNSIEELPIFENCLLLKDLDLSNNQLLDPDMLYRCLEKCVYLENLLIEENPVTDELNSGFFKKLQTVCPRLHIGEQGTSNCDPIKPRTSFETMCLTQSHAVRDIRTLFDNHHKALLTKGQSADLAQLCDVHFKFCEKLFNTLVEYRYAHEYGEVTITVPSAPKTPRSGRPQSARQKEKFMNPKDLFENALKGSSQNGAMTNGGLNITRNNSNMSKNEVAAESNSNPKDMFEQALKSTGNSSSNPKDMFEQALQSTGSSGSNPKDLFDQALKSSGAENNTSQAGAADKSLDKRTSAAITIQAYCRGWLIRHDIAEQTKIWLAVTTIQAAWRGYRVRKITLPEITRRRAVAKVDGKQLMKLNGSATKIQATWRGYILRKKLLAALEYAQCNFSDEEDDDPDVMNMNDEFDVDKFLDFDENQLDSDWMPPETPDIPSSHAVLRKPPSGKPRVPPINTGDSRPPSNPRHAWKMGEMSSMSEYDKMPRPPSSVASTNITARTATSKKEEKLTEEWGFKDTNTAHLMMQRAKKMKYNAERRKKINKLDPKQRLALFRKLEEVTHHPTPQVPQRKTLPRKEYFQARQDEINRQEVEKREEFHTRVFRTFEWLHTQVGDHPVSDSIINTMGPRYAHNNHNLPELQGGKRVQLVSSPGSIELQSVDSASTLGQNARRFSAGSTGSASRLPPIPQTNSAPNHHLKERMSFRNPKTNNDVGWGGGRKRINKF